MLKALELQLGDGELGKEIQVALEEGKGLRPGHLTRLLASQLGLQRPAMPEAPPRPEPEAVPEGEEAPPPPEPFVPPVWAAVGDADEDGVVEWGRAPAGQEALRFVIDGLPLEVLAKDDAATVSPTVHALRTAMLVPTVVVILDDSAGEVEGDVNSDANSRCLGRQRCDASKKSGFMYELGREAELERTKGVSYPFEEAYALQSEALRDGGALCTELAAAGCCIVRLDARIQLEELIEAAAARVDPFVYAKSLESSGANLLGASRIEGFVPAAPYVGGVGPDGLPAAEAEGLQVFGYLKNLCPVTWRREGKLVPGRPDFVARWRGLLYACKGEAQLKAFLENPAYFAPVPAVAPEHQLGMSVDGSCGIDASALRGASMHSIDTLFARRFSHPPTSSHTTSSHIPRSHVLPPIRLMLIGALGSHREKHAAALSAAHNLHVLNLQVRPHTLAACTSSIRPHTLVAYGLIH